MCIDRVQSNGVGLVTGEGLQSEGEGEDDEEKSSLNRQLKTAQARLNEVIQESAVLCTQPPAGGGAPN